MSHHAMTIRAAKPSDYLGHLITLGARRYVPGSNGLVAEVDGAAIAAISLTSGALAADLDRAYPNAVKSLRYRRYQILRQGGDTGRARNVLRRFAPDRPPKKGGLSRTIPVGRERSPVGEMRRSFPSPARAQSSPART
jgi:hypothetical protein